jgi:hypothetical protein
MRLLSRAAVAATVLALVPTAAASAATTHVEIVTKAVINGQSGRVMDTRGDHTITNPAHGNLNTFLKVDVGQNTAMYKEFNNPSKCLTAPPSSNHITLEPCNFGPNQLWTQGFGTATFREFRNLQTGRSATAEQPKNHSVTPVGNYAEVVQQFFTGATNQLWQVRPV